MSQEKVMLMMSLEILSVSRFKFISKRYFSDMLINLYLEHLNIVYSVLFLKQGQDFLLHSPLGGSQPEAGGGRLALGAQTLPSAGLGTAPSDATCACEACSERRYQCCPRDGWEQGHSDMLWSWNRKGAISIKTAGI